MPDISDKQAREITLAFKAVSDCVYAQTGVVDNIELVDARSVKYHITSDKEIQKVIADCIRRLLPTVGVAAKWFLKETLDLIDGS